MKRIIMVVGIVLLAASFALAGGSKSYQVTGPVLESDADHITVQKGNEKWEIAFDKDTKVSGGDVKVGSKVTVFYTMKAASVEVKEAKKAEKPAKEAPKKK